MEAPQIGRRFPSPDLLILFYVIQSSRARVFCGPRIRERVILQPREERVDPAFRLAKSGIAKHIRDPPAHCSQKYTRSEIRGPGAHASGFMSFRGMLFDPPRWYDREYFHIDGCHRTIDVVLQYDE
jgi:hypothetical protein